MARASAGSRAQSRTATPLRPNWTASAVPQLPAPIIAAAPTLDVMLEMSSGRCHAADARLPSRRSVPERSRFTFSW